MKKVIAPVSDLRASAKHQACINARRSYDLNIQGLQDEARVIAFLRSRGLDVMESEAVDDIRHDVDCYVQGVPTSIKAQHTGLAYGDIYLEVTTQQQNTCRWDPQTLNAMYWLASKFPRIAQIGWDEATWQPSWFFTGQAQQYLILQGRELRLYRKPYLISQVAQGAFYKALGLNPKTLVGQRGQNTICIYARRDRLDYDRSWMLPG